MEDGTCPSLHFFAQPEGGCGFVVLFVGAALVGGGCAFQRDRVRGLRSGLLLRVWLRLGSSGRFGGFVGLAGMSVAD